MGSSSTLPVANNDVTNPNGDIGTGGRRHSYSDCLGGTILSKNVAEILKIPVLDSIPNTLLPILRSRLTKQSIHQSLLVRFGLSSGLPAIKSIKLADRLFTSLANAIPISQFIKDVTHLFELSLKLIAMRLIIGFLASWLHHVLKDFYNTSVSTL